LATSQRRGGANARRSAGEYGGRAQRKTTGVRKKDKGCGGAVKMIKKRNGVVGRPGEGRTWVVVGSISDERKRGKENPGDKFDSIP